MWLHTKSMLRDNNSRCWRGESINAVVTGVPLVIGSIWISIISSLILIVIVYNHHFAIGALSLEVSLASTCMTKHISITGCRHIGTGASSRSNRLL